MAKTRRNKIVSSNGEDSDKSNPPKTSYQKFKTPKTNKKKESSKLNKTLAKQLLDANARASSVNEQELYNNFDENFNNTVKPFINLDFVQK